MTIAAVVMLEEEEIAAFMAMMTCARAFGGRMLTPMAMRAAAMTAGVGMEVALGGGSTGPSVTMAMTVAMVPMTMMVATMMMIVTIAVDAFSALAPDARDVLPPAAR